MRLATLQKHYTALPDSIDRRCKQTIERAGKGAPCAGLFLTGTDHCW